MRLGLLADIHEHLENLERALRVLDRQRIDQLVVLGDIFATGSRMEAVCRVLESAGAVGVWGNHDFGLSCQPSDEIRAHFPPNVIRFMTTLRPRLEVADCHCMHVEPWLNPLDIVDLWYFEGPPDTPEKIARIFATTQHAVMFGGHLHRWLLVTPAGIQDWSGDRPIQLDAAERHFVVVNAVCQGSCAVYDTSTRELVPINQDPSGGDGEAGFLLREDPAVSPG